MRGPNGATTTRARREDATSAGRGRGRRCGQSSKFQVTTFRRRADIPEPLLLATSKGSLKVQSSQGLGSLFQNAMLKTAHAPASKVWALVRETVRSGNHDNANDDDSSNNDNNYNNHNDNKHTSNHNDSDNNHHQQTNNRLGAGPVQRNGLLLCLLLCSVLLCLLLLLLFLLLLLVLLLSIVIVCIIVIFYHYYDEQYY